MIALPKCVCPVCEQEFQPNVDNAPASLVYCSAKCAWGYGPSPHRSQESLRRELAALNRVLGEKPN